HVSGGALVEDPRVHVERLRRDPQALRDLRQDLGAGLLDPALDLAEVGVGPAGGLRELAQGHLRRLALLADVVTQRADLQRCHVSSLTPGANCGKHSASRYRGDLTHTAVTWVMPARSGRGLVQEA